MLVSEVTFHSFPASEAVTTPEVTVKSESMPEMTTEGHFDYDDYPDEAAANYGKESAESGEEKGIEQGQFRIRIKVD